MGPFSILLMDPPWQYRVWSKPGRGRTAESHYRTLPPEDLAVLPIPDLAARDSVLFLWTTDPQLPLALELMQLWGFTYKTVGFHWVKRNKGGGYFQGLGHYTRGNVESCLLGIRGKGLPRIRRDVPKLMVSPRQEHSRKPRETHRRIEALYGPEKRVEIFARDPMPGWVSIGDAITGQDVRETLHHYRQLREESA